MENSPNTKPRRKSLSQDQWKDYVAQWQTSGMSQQSFCKREDINYQTFNYWKVKFTDQSAANSKKVTKSKKNVSKVNFVALEGLAEPSTQMQISLGNGINLSWNGEVPPNYIKSLIEVLVV